MFLPTISRAIAVKYYLPTPEGGPLFRDADNGSRISRVEWDGTQWAVVNIERTEPGTSIIRYSGTIEGAPLLDSSITPINLSNYLTDPDANALPSGANPLAAFWRKENSDGESITDAPVIYAGLDASYSALMGILGGTSSFFTSESGKVYSFERSSLGSVEQGDEEIGPNTDLYLGSASGTEYGATSLPTITLTIDAYITS